MPRRFLAAILFSPVIAEPILAKTILSNRLMTKPKSASNIFANPGNTESRIN